MLYHSYKALIVEEFFEPTKVHYQSNMNRP